MAKLPSSPFGTCTVGAISAGITIAVIPILIFFLLLKRSIIKSVASTGLNG